MYAYPAVEWVKRGSGEAGKSEAEKMRRTLGSWDSERNEGTKNTPKRGKILLFLLDSERSSI